MTMIVCRAPIHITTNPNKKFPKTPPSDSAEPIQDLSPIEILPVSNGLSSDCSNGSAIDSQPIPQPYPITIKLASFWNK